MKDVVTVVAASSAEYAYSSSLRARLEEIGIRTWAIDIVSVGDSLVEEIDRAIRSSKMLILVVSAASSPDHWSQIQVRAFQAGLQLTSALKLVIVPIDDMVLTPTLLAQSVVLASQLQPNVAADFCAAMLYVSPTTSTFVAASTPMISGSPILYASAWPLQPDLTESAYAQYVNTIHSLIDLQEYEPAVVLYWKVLYYSGFRGLWTQRLQLSGRLLNLSLKMGDAVTASYILIDGIAYTYLMLGSYAKARRALVRAYAITEESKDRRAGGKAWGYMAEALAASGRLQEADTAYGEGIEALEGIDRFRMELKRLHLRLRNADLPVANRVARFSQLRDEFASIYDYHAPMVEIEIASYDLIAGDLEHAGRMAYAATEMLSKVIKMPREAKRGEDLLRRIERSRR